MKPVRLGVLLSAEEEQSIIRRGFLAFDAVPSMPPFVYDETDLGGETSGRRVLEFVDFGSEAE